MQRLRIELHQIAEHANLLRAAWLATRGRQRRPAAARLLADLDARLAALGQRIRSGQAPVGQQRQFVIHDPKRRLITAACLDDWVQRLRTGQAAGHDDADLQRAHDAALATLAGSQTLHWRQGLWPDAAAPPQTAPL